MKIIVAVLLFVATNAHASSWITKFQTGLNHAKRCGAVHVSPNSGRFMWGGQAAKLPDVLSSLLQDVDPQFLNSQLVMRVESIRTFERVRSEAELDMGKEDFVLVQALLAGPRAGLESPMTIGLHNETIQLDPKAMRALLNLRDRMEPFRDVIEAIEANHIDYQHGWHHRIVYNSKGPEVETLVRSVEEILSQRLFEGSGIGFAKVPPMRASDASTLVGYLEHVIAGKTPVQEFAPEAYNALADFGGKKDRVSSLAGPLLGWVAQRHQRDRNAREPSHSLVLEDMAKTLLVRAFEDGRGLDAIVVAIPSIFASGRAPGIAIGTELLMWENRNVGLEIASATKIGQYFEKIRNAKASREQIEKTAELLTLSLVETAVLHAEKIEAMFAGREVPPQAIAGVNKQIQLALRTLQVYESEGSLVSERVDWGRARQMVESLKIEKGEEFEPEFRKNSYNKFWRELPRLMGLKPNESLLTLSRGQ